MNRREAALAGVKAGFGPLAAGVALAGLLLVAPIISLFLGLPIGLWAALLAGWIAHYAFQIAFVGLALDLFLAIFFWQRVRLFSVTAFFLGLVGTVFVSFRVVLS